jgi:hypothetical protein
MIAAIFFARRNSCPRLTLALPSAIASGLLARWLLCGTLPFFASR